MNYVHMPLLLQSVTSLHVGCGQDVGVVDLPVIRERLTGFPFIPGSGLRGALRARLEVPAEPGKGMPAEAQWLFGPRVQEEVDARFAGCLSVHDAKLLLFPVRSEKGSEQP